MALEAPIEVFEGSKWFWAASYAAAGVAYITAGEWLANNVQMAKKVVPFTDHSVLAQSVSGGFATTIAGLIGTSDVTNVKQQRALGVGYLVTGLAVIVRNRKTVGPIGRVQCVLLIATGLLNLVFKPKARKAAAAGAAAAAAGKK